MHVTYAEPTPLQLDALREVANVGCGHAASALSRLVGGSRVSIGVPHVSLATLAELPRLLGGPKLPVVAATLEIVGQLGGHLLVVLPEGDARALTGLMLDEEIEGLLEGAHKDAFGEVANILASACLSAIGTLTGLKLLPSVPQLRQGEVAPLLASEIARGGHATHDPVVALEARFETRTSPPFAGQMVVLPNPESLRTLLGRLGV